MYLDKREREQKEYAQAAWAARRDRENALIDSLTPEQHATLSDLCADRHYMHVNAESDIWKETCHISATYTMVGGIMSESKINGSLREVGLPEIDFANYDNCDNIGTYDYECKTEEEREEAEERAIDAIREVAEQNDVKIREYLRKIDEEHGTKYAPTGMGNRMMY